MWLHQGRKLKKGKTHGSLILGITTLEGQRQALEEGIIIEGGTYDTRLYEQGLQHKQCFRCQDWGHTQVSCSKKQKCGHCTREHRTSECTYKTEAKCANCLRDHKAWDRTKCKMYKAYSQQIQRSTSYSTSCTPSSSTSTYTDMDCFDAIR